MTLVRISPVFRRLAVMVVASVPACVAEAADDDSAQSDAANDGEREVLSLSDLNNRCAAETTVVACQNESEAIEEAFSSCKRTGENTEFTCGCQWRQAWTVDDACVITEDPGGSCVGYTIQPGRDGCVGGTQLGACENLYFGISTGESAYTVAMVNDDCDADLGIDGEVCAGFGEPSAKCACAEQVVTTVCGSM